MSIMIPSCNAHAYMKFSKKNFAPYAKNATVKNIITINKYNVGIKSLDRAIIVSDTLKTETSPIFISQVRVPVPVPVPFPFLAPPPVADSGFSIRPFLATEALGKNTLSDRRQSVHTFPLFVRQLPQMCQRCISTLNLTSYLCSEFYGHD